jgi:hypothetical protein
MVEQVQEAPMLRGWFGRRGERRRVEVDARAERVRERTFVVVRALADPLVTEGLAWSGLSRLQRSRTVL